MKKMQLLTVSDIEPGGLDVDVARTGNLFPVEGIEEKIAGGDHVPGSQGQVVKAGEGRIVHESSLTGGERAARGVSLRGIRVGARVSA